MCEWRPLFRFLLVLGTFPSNKNEKRFSNFAFGWSQSFVDSLLVFYVLSEHISACADNQGAQTQFLLVDTRLNRFTKEKFCIKLNHGKLLWLWDHKPKQATLWNLMDLYRISKSEDVAIQVETVDVLLDTLGEPRNDCAFIPISKIASKAPVCSRKMFCCWIFHRWLKIFDANCVLLSKMCRGLES